MKDSKAISTIKNLRYALVMKDHRIVRLEEEIARLKKRISSLSVPLQPPHAATPTTQEAQRQQPRTSP